MESALKRLTGKTLALDFVKHSGAALGCIAVGAVVGYGYARSSRRQAAVAHKVKVCDMFVYPIKGCRGIRVPTAKITANGFEGDRMLMIVNEAGKMQSQRQILAMAKVRPFWSEAGDLVLTAPHCGDFVVSRDALNRDGEHRSVSVWGHVCPDAIDMGDRAANWLSDALSTPNLRLVRMPDHHRRKRKSNHVSGGSYTVSFADQSPISVASERSLQTVRDNAGAPSLGMDRFRQNIVVDGDLQPFQENMWTEITIGAATLCALKLIERCQVPRIEQSMGTLNLQANKEPTTALKKLTDNHFGVHFVPWCSNNIYVSVGDTLVVQQKRKK